MQSQVESNEPDSSQDSLELQTTDFNLFESRYDTDKLQAQLRNNLALFLKMHSVLHVSDMAIQDIVESLVQIFSLSKPLVRDSIIMVLREHDQTLSELLLNE